MRRSGGRGFNSRHLHHFEDWLAKDPVLLCRAGSFVRNAILLTDFFVIASVAATFSPRSLLSSAHWRDSSALNTSRRKIRNKRLAEVLFRRVPLIGIDRGKLGVVHHRCQPARHGLKRYPPADQPKLMAQKLSDHPLPTSIFLRFGPVPRRSNLSSEHRMNLPSRAKSSPTEKALQKMCARFVIRVPPPTGILTTAQASPLPLHFVRAARITAAKCSVATPFFLPKKGDEFLICFPREP